MVFFLYPGRKNGFTQKESVKNTNSYSEIYDTMKQTKCRNTNEIILDMSQNADVLEKEEAMKIEKKLSKLFDAWEDEQISDNEFVKRKAVNNQRVENIKAEIEKLENSIPEKEEYEEKIMARSDALDSLLDENIDADIQNEYLKQIIDKIEFSRENNKEFILDVFLK